MRRILVTTGTAHIDFADVCWESQRRYAERVGAEFHLVMDAPTENPYKNRFHLIETALTDAKGTDRVLWLDWDILVADNAEDLFNDCPATGVALPVWNTWRGIDMRAAQRRHSMNFTLPNYYNIGVMLYKARENRKLLEAMSLPQVTACYANKRLLEASAPFELGVNVALSVLKTHITDLPNKFHTVAPAHGMFTHYIGPDKYDHSNPFFPRHENPSR